jgi:hypothetical protein
LFTYRLEQAVHDANEHITRQSLNKRPDRIIGLERTTTFDSYLDAVYAHEEEQYERPKRVQEKVKTTVTADIGDELLFPFLILEAKKSNSNGDFEYMTYQSAVPIKHALYLQYDLNEAYGNRFAHTQKPLVWFLANRGAEWQVSAGYVYPDKHDTRRANYVGLICNEVTLDLTCI